MRRGDYIIKRTGFALATIFIAITLNFFLFRVLPGSAITNIARIPHASLQLQESLKRQFGLDKPVWVQYLLYLRQLAHGNLGISWADQQPVRTHLASDLANTVPMLTLGTVLAMVAGIATGVVAAWRRGRAADYGNTGVALLFYSFPTQWLGLMLLILLASYLPAGGMSDPFLLGATFWQRVADTTRHMILPSLTVALTLYGGYALIVRSAMLETLGEDYVLTARAKGLPQRTIVARHALRNAMLPVITLVALSLGFIIGGFITIEYVFSYSRIGPAPLGGIYQRDYPILQGAFLLLALAVIFFNLIADLVYFRLDPRITT